MGKYEKIHQQREFYQQKRWDGNDTHWALQPTILCLGVQWIGSREQFDRKPCFASNCEQSVYIKPLDTDTQWAKHGWHFACQMWRPSGNQT